MLSLPGRALYRPPGIPVLVGSGSYSPTQQGIPTHRYGGPAALKVEFMESANMLGARPSTRSHPAHSSVMYVGSEQCSYFAYFEQSTDPCYIIPETRMSIHRSLLHILNYPPSTDT